MPEREPDAVSPTPSAGASAHTLRRRLREVGIRVQTTVDREVLHYARRPLLMRVSVGLTIVSLLMLAGMWGLSAWAPASPLLLLLLPAPPALILGVMGMLLGLVRAAGVWGGRYLGVGVDHTLAITPHALVLGRTSMPLDEISAVEIQKTVDQHRVVVCHREARVPVAWEQNLDRLEAIQAWIQYHSRRRVAALSAEGHDLGARAVLPAALEALRER